MRHLLIDEFQDTNPLQWQALSSWLAGYSGAGRAPSVFIVGDPKQSIYRFRRAEPQVFKAAKEFVVDGLGGDLLSCDHTRRNAPPIIALVNQVMGQAQDEGAFDGYRAHSTESQELGSVLKLPRILRDTAGDGEEAENTEWRDSLTMPRRLLEDTRKTLECRQAARWLAQQLQVPGTTLRPRDIMVLARKRERLGLMQAELAALHIAAQQPEKNELADMPEVQDIVALLDVLVSPRHDLSLARVLKSPLFGVGDADLVQLVLRLRQMQALQAPDPAGAPSPVVTWLQVLQETTDLPAALAPVGTQLALWKQWLDTLPPHDALSAIYQDGDVLARYAAATPPNQCAGVLANLQATLMAALQVDGGRYATAYSLVRALRAGGIAAPVRADASAVRLLTIHGAKGLEAPLVLVLDTDGEAQKSETMGVLVNWPGEHAYPQRFVFLASESKPPACVADALALEQAARSREELNALYVALTRTQHTLVVSSLEPHIKNPGSWWQRLEAQAQDAQWQLDGAGLAPVGLDMSADVPRTCTLKALPKLMTNSAIDTVEYAQAAIKIIAKTGLDEADGLESRIGQAMHRLLEWLAPQPADGAALPWSAVQMAAVAREFALEGVQVAEASTMALGILHGDGAWIWDASQISWHCNELALTHRGRLLRLDRLVQHKGSGQWWVLDYKSNANPQQDPALRAQLLTYRSAVAQAYAGQTVRAAFLTPQGALIELRFDGNADCLTGSEYEL